MPSKHRILQIVRKYFLLELGALIDAIGLEIFLLPNDIIDGGVIGISIITSYLTKIPLGILITVLTLPFLWVGYKQIGKSFVISTLFAVVSLSFWVTILHPVPGLTKDVLLATVFGGVILGIGVGLIIRTGGSLDGTEIVAVILDKRTGFSVGEIVMFFNLFILSSAGFVFGWNKAMYSLIAYFIAFKMIDVVIRGLDEEKAAWIVSKKGDAIREAIMYRLGRGATVLEATGGYTNTPKTLIYSVVTRLEVAKLKQIVHEIDETAFVTINDVNDVMGGKHHKRAIH